MKTICYIIPYFGKLPKNFALYLLSCAQNPTVNWKILTDDRTPYEFPTNVQYCNYEEVKQRIKAWFDFETVIDRPWRLSLFKPAYGEIFAEELSGYDFWGHCDIDLMWGNIRTFYSENNLNKYERLGFLGHSTLYKNTPVTSGSSPEKSITKTYSAAEATIASMKTGWMRFTGI